MSYAPSTFHAGTGEDFFLKEGFLTGMAPIISARYDIPAFDGSDGTALTITNSVAKAGATGAESWAGWNLGATYTKLLITTYVHSCPANGLGVGAKVDVLPVGVIKPATYQARFNIYSYNSIGKYTADPGSSFSSIASTTSIYQKQEFVAAVWGMALYLDGTSNVQKTFIKSGTAEWFPVLTTGDTDHSSFQSVYLRHQGDDARYICPIMVWGS